MAERNIEQQYQDDNYRIDDISEIKRVLILCTSNGGWKENTYEWENLTQNPKIREYFGKIVFLRDVYRHFYIEGLNPRINCIDAIVDVLKEKIRGGYDIITAGFSAGGYLAMVLGARLGARVVFSFAGIFDVGKWTGSKNEYLVSDCEWYKKRLGNSIYEKYYNIRQLLVESKVPVYHCMSAFNEADNIQIREADGIENLRIIAFKSSVHGKTMLGSSIPDLITADDSRLKRLAESFNGRSATRFTFSLRLIGVFRTLRLYLSRLMSRLGVKHNEKTKVS